MENEKVRETFIFGLNRIWDFPSRDRILHPLEKQKPLSNSYGPLQDYVLTRYLNRARSLTCNNLPLLLRRPRLRILTSNRYIPRKCSATNRIIKVRSDSGSNVAEGICLYTYE